MVTQKLMCAQFATCLMLGTSLVLTGCTSPQYQLVKDSDYLPPTPIACGANDEYAKAELLYLIFYESPGSWKREALWDEYLFKITNISECPIELSNLFITDPLGTDISATENIWKVHKFNRWHLQQYRKAGIIATNERGLLEATAAASALVAMEVALNSAVGAGLAVGGYSSLYVVAAGAFVVLPAALVVGTGTAIKNSKARKLINEEVERRSLDFPIILSPETSIEGSLFFPVIPSPAAFKLSYQITDPGTDPENRFLMGSLAPLDGLHVKRKKK